MNGQSTSDNTLDALTADFKGVHKKGCIATYVSYRKKYLPVLNRQTGPIWHTIFVLVSFFLLFFSSISFTHRRATIVVGTTVRRFKGALDNILKLSFWLNLSGKNDC